MNLLSKTLTTLNSLAIGTAFMLPNGGPTYTKGSTISSTNCHAYNQHTKKVVELTKSREVYTILS